MKEIQVRNKATSDDEKTRLKAISRLITKINYSDFAGAAGLAGFAAESVL
jgi:hypothetical protein